jgi:putative oxidoreductase
MAPEEVMSDEWPVTSTPSTINHPSFARRKVAWRIVDFAVGGVFVYAGVLKALDPVRFAMDIDNYKIVPWFISVAMSFYLPWLEILGGLALISRFLYRGGLSILTALVLIFIGATMAAKARGLDITCGCFGHASEHWSFPQHMAIDLAILAVLIFLSIRLKWVSNR